MWTVQIQSDRRAVAAVGGTVATEAYRRAHRVVASEYVHGGSDLPSTHEITGGGSNANPGASRPMFESFRADRRAIEGLPIRLVIALVIGVASLSVMMNMLTGIQGLSTTELDVRPEPEVVSPGETSIELTVVGADGSSVADATVIVKAGSADLDGVRTATTGEDGTVTVSAAPSLRSNQDEGTLLIEVKPPAGSGYVDRRGNAKVLVVRG